MHVEEVEISGKCLAHSLFTLHYTLSPALIYYIVEPEVKMLTGQQVLQVPTLGFFLSVLVQSDILQMTEQWFPQMSSSPPLSTPLNMVQIC